MKTEAQITLEVARENASNWSAVANDCNIPFLPWPGAALVEGLRRSDRVEMCLRMGGKLERIEGDHFVIRG